VPDRCARRPLTLSAVFGGICGTEILQATNFGVSIHSAVTSWISIVRPQSSRSNWMMVGITIAPDRFAIERDRNFWLARGLLCSDFGIIRFARNSTASCKRSGLRCRSDARRNPHLNPLPLGKGEARLAWSCNRRFKPASTSGRTKLNSAAKLR
jgi:hypothetical protein